MGTLQLQAIYLRIITIKKMEKEMIREAIICARCGANVIPTQVQCEYCGAQFMPIKLESLPTETRKVEVRIMPLRGVDGKGHKNISKMQNGEYGYTVPWALGRDKIGLGIHPEYSVHKDSGGTAVLKVTKIDDIFHISEADYVKRKITGWENIDLLPVIVSS